MTTKSIRHILEAIEQGQLKKLISLIKHGYNINVKNSLRQNLLVYLLQQQHHQQDALLIKKRFQIFEFLLANHNLDIHSLDSYRKNIFNWAANLNCTQEALYLLKLYPGDIDILGRDQLGSCSLHYAVEHGNEILVHAIVNYLLRYRLRFDIKDAFNNTPENLAKKLGHDTIYHFLTQACRSTVYMSRETSSQQQRPSSPSPTTSKTKMIRTSPLSSSSSVPVLSEYFNLIELRINAAKSVEDWKTVAAFRAFKKPITAKKSHRIPDLMHETDTRRSSIPSLPQIPSNHSRSQAGSQSEQMLRLFELHLSPSFRRSFIPVYQQTMTSTVTLHQSPNGLSKNSHSPSGHMASVSQHRKRDSGASQSSTVPLQDGQSLLSVPPVYRQHRPSVVATN